MTDVYDPELCNQAEELFGRGKNDEALEVALKAHKLAIEEAEQRWKSVVNETSGLAMQTKMWDTTTQQNVDHSTYLKVHNWEDDIAPAPARIAGKILRSMGKEAKRNDDIHKAIEYFEKLRELDVATDTDLKLLGKLKQQ